MREGTKRFVLKQHGLQSEAGPEHPKADSQQTSNEKFVGGRNGGYYSAEMWSDLMGLWVCKAACKCHFLNANGGLKVFP